MGQVSLDHCSGERNPTLQGQGTRGRWTAFLSDPGMTSCVMDSHVLSLTQEQAIGLSVMFFSFLIPAGWVLSHLDSYKKGSAA